MSSLTSARRRLHGASQWLARLAYAFATPKDDDSHSALVWRDGALHTQPLASVGPAQLDAVTLALTLAGRTVPLAGLDEAQRYDGLMALLAAIGLEQARVEVALPWTGEAPDADVMAEHAVGEATVERLARLYEDASLALSELTSATPAASPVRLWPHHFDIASLLSGTSPFDSIGVGLAPDDAHIDVPYWYVAPWPAASPSSLPEAPEGWRWQREGFSALVSPRVDGDSGAINAAALKEVIEVARRATPLPGEHE